jgi:hypothetical protein
MYFVLVLVIEFLYIDYTTKSLKNPSFQIKKALQHSSQRADDFLAPRVGFEPTTLRLTAGCSTVELPRKVTSNYTQKLYSSQ